MRRINNIPIFLAPGIGAKNSLSFSLRDDVDKSLDPFTITVFEVVNEEKTIAMFSAESISGNRGHQTRRVFSGRAYLRSRFTIDASVSSVIDVEYDEVFL